VLLNKLSIYIDIIIKNFLLFARQVW
jgi:hypothetical protein